MAENKYAYAQIESRKLTVSTGGNAPITEWSIVTNVFTYTKIQWAGGCIQLNTVIRTDWISMSKSLTEVNHPYLEYVKGRGVLFG